jgi:MFS family permease
VHPARAEPRRAQLAVASLGVMLAAADTYVVVIALPDIMSGVGLGIDELQRATPIVSAFLLGYIVMLPLIGRLSDLHGRLPVLVGCLVVFAIGSLFTASAHDLGGVVAGRALQGIGAGGLVPATLALVADLWSAERRGLPLGVVGAVQEAGTVLGPLYGGAVLAMSGWRTIFWVNLTGAVVLATALLALARPIRGRQTRRVPIASGVLGLLALTGVVLTVTAPTVLTEQVTLGTIYVPTISDAAWTSPIAIVSGALTAAAAVRLFDRTTLSRLLTEADALGAVLLGLTLTGVVLSFATADPSRQTITDQAPLLLTGSATGAVLFMLRQRRAKHPLVPHQSLTNRAAKGALAVNFFVGAALVAALVNVPIFARTTRYPHSQLGASLVLAQLLVTLPIGAVLGGWLCARFPARAVAAAGMGLAATGFTAMAQWNNHALDQPASTAILLATGLGFGLAIAPVNQALLAATRTDVHGVSTALVVVSRTIGMLVGLSALTAIGLHVFYTQQRHIGTPLSLCPTSPGHCPLYDQQTRLALLNELHAIFWSAGLCAALAALLAAALLAPTRSNKALPRN